MKLNHEVENYNATTGLVNYWVKVPTLSHSNDTTIYMCYSNAAVTTDQSNASGVWDTNYKGVWHLGNGSTLSGTDSTGQLNGTNHSATANSGKVGGAAGFNGANQNLSVGGSGLTSGITLEAWVYRTGFNSFDVFADFGWNSTDGFVALVGGTSPNHGFVKHAVQYVDSGIASPLNTWQHIVWTVAADKKPRLYINGSLVFTSTDTGALVAATHGGSLGARLDSSGNASQSFTGRVDEARLSNVVRSADWLTTEYNNQSSPATFYTISTSITVAANINWLVTDQLGTPRMIFDKSGTLANVKRHDYLPFGEELTESQGLRTAAMGYIPPAQVLDADKVRQKFTQKERDVETGLDYFGARYYGSFQARFTSPDPLLSSGHVEDPQTWNRYAYTLNNPLCFIDPTGLFTINSRLSAEQQQQIIAAYDALKAALGKLDVSSKSFKNLNRSLKKLGKPGDANGVVVTIGKLVDPRAVGETDVNNVGKGTITITFNENKFAGESLESRAATLGHEGVHADDAANVFAGSKSMAAFFRAWESYRYQTEYDAHFIDAGIFQVLDSNHGYGWGYYTPPTLPGKAQNIPQVMDMWNPSWKVLDQKVIESRQSATIRTFLQAPTSTSFGYGLKEPKGFKP